MFNANGYTENAHNLKVFIWILKFYKNLMERYIGWYSYAFDRFFFYVRSGEIWYYSYKIKNGSLFDLKIRNLLICRLKNKTISLMANIFESPMNSYFIIIS